MLIYLASHAFLLLQKWPLWLSHHWMAIFISNLLLWLDVTGLTLITLCLVFLSVRRGILSYSRLFYQYIFSGSSFLPRGSSYTWTDGICVETGPGHLCLSHTTVVMFMMTPWHGTAFRFTYSSCGETTGRQWIPLTKGPVMRVYDFFNLFSVWAVAQKAMLPVI